MPLKKQLGQTLSLFLGCIGTGGQVRPDTEGAAM